MLTRIALLVALSAVMYSHQAAAQEHSILTYHGDARRSGNFVVPSLTWEKARSLHFDERLLTPASSVTSMLSRCIGTCPDRTLQCCW